MASNKAATSMFWAIGERFATQGTLFVISLILARLLSPSDYGTLSLLLVFTNLADVLVTNGLGEALIQKSDINQIDYSTMLSCSIALSSILYVLIFFAAPSIADFYGNANMCLYLRVLALRLPLSALNAIQKAYIAKQLTEETWETELRIEMPHKHYVNMTPAVAECRAKMYSELHGGKV